MSHLPSRPSHSSHPSDSSHSLDPPEPSPFSPASASPESGDVAASKEPGPAPSPVSPPRLVIDASDLSEPPAKKPDRLVVDLDAEPSPAAPRLVIDQPDLGPAASAAGKPAPFAVPKAEFPAKPSAGVLPIFGSRLSESLVGGLVGGALAWLVGEPLLAILGALAREGVGRQLADATLYGLLLGGLAGGALMAIESVAVRAWVRACHRGAVGAAIGAVGGALGGLFAQAVNSLLVGAWGVSPRSVSGLLLYAVGWSMMGLAIGLAPAVRTPSSDLARRGILGGAAGGLIGGALFAAVRMGAPGAASRLVAVLLLGASLGLAIGLVERLLRQAWLKVIAGPLTGKEFVVDRRRMTIGSVPAADIFLARDPKVAPLAAEIVVERERHVIRDLGGGVLTVNDALVHEHVLRRGDRIAIGRTAFRYDETPSTKESGGW
jgi:hypothetical protein